MNEEEAKTKWCPFASSRVVPWQKAPGALINAIQAEAEGSPPSTACIASACMAWRWEPSGDNRDKIEAIRAHREKHGSDLRTAKEAVEASWSDPKVQGFCGLAGAPR